jgi:hypothetical protein
LLVWENIKNHNSPKYTLLSHYHKVKKKILS